VADATTKRTAAEDAAKAAARERSEAERRRREAEVARREAEDAARTAKDAAAAAERQRTVAEQATRTATAAKQSAEHSLGELTARRQAAERAAVDLEARSKAEAKVQAEVERAKQQQLTAAERTQLAKLRGEATRLADERKRAEGELAERRKAVEVQQAEAARLALAAREARDAAAREDTRRTQLAQLRAAEEAELARLRAQRDVLAAKPVAAPAPSPAPAAKAALATVQDITFTGTGDTASVDLKLAGAAKVALGEVTATHVELIVDNAQLAGKLERKLDVTRFGTGVRAVSSFRDRRTPNRVRLVAELAQPMTPTIEYAAGRASWRFVGNQLAKRTLPPPRTQAVPPPVMGGFGAASTPIAQQSVGQVPAAPQGRRTRVYRGATVDFDFKDAPIHDLLRTIAETGRVNIVVPDNITARVTVRLKRVPWDQALEVILSSHGLWYRREGNLYRIADRKELDKEDQEAAARAEAARKAETPRPEVVRLNYASASDLRPKLQGMVSPNGSLEVDDRQNALIINDVAGNRAQIAQLALSLDRQTPQISIEARIVEARSTFLRQLGVQWGGRATASAQGGNATGLLFPSNISLLGGNDDANTVRNGVAAPSDFAINLPAAVGAGEGGGIGLSLGSIGGNFAINLRLTALEDVGTIRIISAPKITVLNNKPARITQGVSIPIQVLSAQGTNTQLIQADLKLEVTPYVSLRDCAVQMKLDVAKNEPDFVNVGARGDPSFLRKEASTTMLVADGDTSVLGGIYTRNSGLAYKKVPFFADLPVIGWFFKNRRENDDRTEILVFITPKITNRKEIGCP
jgi:type IV pilus assembly protein PilQ